VIETTDEERQKRSALAERARAQAHAQAEAYWARWRRDGTPPFEAMRELNRMLNLTIKHIWEDDD
jgi:hypothetical protein